MDVCKCIVPSRHWGSLNSRRATSPLVRLVEGEERWESPDDPQGILPQNWGKIELNRAVTCVPSQRSSIPLRTETHRLLKCPSFNTRLSGTDGNGQHAQHAWTSHIKNHLPRSQHGTNKKKEHCIPKEVRLWEKFAELLKKNSRQHHFKKPRLSKCVNMFRS
ncbi:uncharacterized protein TNCV_2079231 [Trichonephila clavipes]|nr:uncharacterized protein TNCV_2079231 [Trichonephila clavipes]